MQSAIAVQRARIEEIREMSEEYRDEASNASSDGLPWDAPIPQGGIFWVARDQDGNDVGYAAGTMRPTGCTVGPVYVRDSARRLGVGRHLLVSIQEWAGATRVPVVEITVAADNPLGQQFLEALGYQPRRILMSLQPVVD